MVIFILSQIIYPQHKTDQGMSFLCPSHKELAKVMWKNGEAAGFYAVKEKGRTIINTYKVKPAMSAPVMTGQPVKTGQVLSIL